MAFDKSSPTMLKSENIAVLSANFPDLDSLNSK